MASSNFDTQTWHNIISGLLNCQKVDQTARRLVTHHKIHTSPLTWSQKLAETAPVTQICWLWMVTSIGRINWSICYTNNHLRLCLLAGNWHCVIGIFCAALATTETAGRFRSSICLTLLCALDHHVVWCPCTLLPPMTTQWSLFCLLRCHALGTSWDIFILWADSWR